jgi:hypothetical protein
MSYALADRAAAMQDLTAMEGETVTVAGRSVLAYFERSPESQDADPYGADDRREVATISFLWTGSALFFGDEVRARGKTWKIAEIDQQGENLVTLTIENDK